MINYRRVVIGILVLSFISGCGLSRPRWRWPGSIEAQQMRASYHDPYADNDAAPRAIGARPRDFEMPRAEPIRARVFTDSQRPF